MLFLACSEGRGRSYPGPSHDSSYPPYSRHPAFAWFPLDDKAVSQAQCRKNNRLKPFSSPMMLA
jgi:hypothetical protein